MQEAADGNLLTQFLIILGLVLINGLFSMSELAVVSVRRARMQQLSDEGDGRADVVLDLAAHPNTFLSTIQVGITLIGVLAGAYGGATIGPQLAKPISHLPLLSPYASAIGLVLAVVVTTFLSLVLGELVPKRIALQYAERIALVVAKPMTVLSRLVGETLTFDDLELLKAFQGIHTHETRVSLPVFGNDQDMVRLADQVEAYLAGPPALPGYLIAGHGLYSWGDSVEEAARHLEAFEFLFECELAMRKVASP